MVTTEKVRPDASEWELFRSIRRRAAFTLDVPIIGWTDTPSGLRIPIPPIAGGAIARARDPMALAQFRTQMREQPEDIYQPFYDRVNFPAAGAFEIAFFATPVGGSATLIRAGATGTFTKTRRDTNLEQQGVVPTKALQVHGFSVSYVPVQQAVGAAATGSIPDDVQRLMYGAFLELRLIDKPYFYLPNVLLPSTGVLRGMASTTLTASTIVAAPGSGSGNPRDCFWTGVPLTIDPYQNFSARMQFDGSPPTGQTYDIYLFMHCYVRRPGQ